MKTVSLVLLLGGLLMAGGCDNPFAPDQKVILGVSKLDAPATVAAGSQLTVTLTVTTGGCKSFDHLEVTRDASSASLTAWGTDTSVGTNVACTANVIETPHTQTFDPPFQSPFTVYVVRGRLSPLIATVQVQ